MLFLSVFTAEPGVEHALKVLLRHNMSFDRWKGIRKLQRLARGWVRQIFPALGQQELTTGGFFHLRIIGQDAKFSLQYEIANPRGGSSSHLWPICVTGIAKFCTGTAASLRIFVCLAIYLSVSVCILIVVFKQLECQLVPSAEAAFVCLLVQLGKPYKCGGDGQMEHLAKFILTYFPLENFLLPARLTFQKILVYN